ncbi:MAG: cytochrome c-type biogenesis protein CcmH [Rhizobacter sp.]|nr:cytochrome c-type biogenesis protein CcmH [Rhizobacter sp.]
MKNLRFIVPLLLLLCLAAPGVPAKEAAPIAADPVLEARAMAIAAELRCLVCQNQTIADSSSGLADDLRREVREQLRRGASNEQVVTYMTDRYGDFVRYRPPFKPSTVLLWAGPALLLVGGLTALGLVLRRRARLSPDQFEADEAEEADAVGAGGAADVTDPARERTVANPNIAKDRDS